MCVLVARDLAGPGIIRRGRLYPELNVVFSNPTLGCLADFSRHVRIKIVQYEEERIRLRLKTRPVRYGQDCRPVDSAVYQKIDGDFKQRPVFDLWEAMFPNSEGWLGVIDEEGDRLIEGDFETYIHTGSYKDLMEIGMEIGRTHIKMSEFYFVYLNSPEETAEADLKTKIVFKE